MPEKKSNSPLATSHPKLKVGLLGGSFNPAHDGHLHISRIALKKLKLDEIWWLVSPQNPLKPTEGMMPLSKRLKSAEDIIASDKKLTGKVIASDMERKLATVYTADTISQLRKKFPQTEFFWLMGTDNLLQFTKWKNWENILKMVEVHVFDRGKDFKQASKLEIFPQVTYHKIKKNPLSSTLIRNSFLRCF